MKITTYELLGLVKDSKAPKKIKYGNVKLTYNEDETEIIDVKWDEERYQKLLESYVEEEDDLKTFDDIVKENALLKAQVEALSQNQEFLEDCLIEVGQVIYA